MNRACIVSLVVLVAALAAPTMAHAEETEPGADRDRARAAMEDYFAGEKRGGYVLAGMGVAGLLAGGLLHRSSSRRARSAAYPLSPVPVPEGARGSRRTRPRERTRRLGSPAVRLLAPSRGGRS